MGEQWQNQGHGRGQEQGRGPVLKKQKNCTIVNAYKTILGLEDWVKEVARPQGSSATRYSSKQFLE